jgi:phosphatidylethanolamine/phosphatidyl-N-methylethanolamine N-methyltransferase
MHPWLECGKFFRICRSNFRTTGAILPSSRFLARALAKHLGGPRPPARILEVGPGSGSVTLEIARRMRPGDRLDTVEINRRFVELLTQRVATEDVFSPVRDQIEIVHGALQDLPGESVYDYIVSALPINNFSVDLVREIFASYSRLLKPDGVLTYYEYVLLRQLKTPFVNRRERRRLFRLGRVVNSYVRDFQIFRERIYINVPPATVRHLRLKPVDHPVELPREQTAVK